jgi:hypothetical protein
MPELWIVPSPWGNSGLRAAPSPFWGCCVPSSSRPLEAAVDHNKRNHNKPWSGTLLLNTHFSLSLFLYYSAFSGLLYVQFDVDILISNLVLLASACWVGSSNPSNWTNGRLQSELHYLPWATPVQRRFSLVDSYLLERPSRKHFQTSSPQPPG